MRRVFLFAIMLAMIGTVISQTITSVEKQDIVEPNHFFSASLKEKKYNLGSLKKDKSLAIVLKSSEKDQYLIGNKITLTINVGSANKECVFVSYEEMCVLDNTPEEKGSMTIKCQNSPCQATWKVIQPQVNELKDNDHIQKFYKISSDDKRKLHLNIICTDIQINDISNLFKVYSTMPILQFDNQRKAYILINDPKQGYIYFQMQKQFASCASIKVDRIPDTLTKDVTEDIIIKNKQSVYKLEDLPNHDFRVDLGLHMIAPSSDQKNNLNIKIVGEKDGSNKTLRQSKITIPEISQTFDLSYGIPKISDYSQVKLVFTTNMRGAILDFNLGQDQRQQVEVNQINYFDLKKGQKLSYKLIGMQKALDQKVKIHPFDQKKVNVTKTQCPIKEGCQFQIEAIQDANGYVSLGVGDVNLPENQQIVILDMGSDKSYSKKMREGQKIYLKKKLQKDDGFQMVINTMNAMVYMATNKKCTLPSKQCYNKIGTLQRHFIFIPHDDDQKQAIFMIEALDSCQFTMTLLYQEGETIRLVDSTPFSYLFDNNEDQLKFAFTRDDKKDVSFNLVGPMNALDLIAVNNKKLPKDLQDAQVSSDGYLKFQAKDAKNDDFTIIVKKKDSHKDSFVHFVLVASTEGQQIRLQSGITYYQTLTKKSQDQGKKHPKTTEYIFQFDTDKDYVLNFYSHNLKEQQVKIYLALSASNDDWSNKDKTTRMQIDQTSDVLDLSQISQKLCINSGQGNSNCQLFMRMMNPMNIQIDIAITLMTRQSIIQMHSGVWQSFNLHSVAKSAHFYYQPKLKGKDVNIYFKSSDPGLRISYVLYAGAYDTINPQQWPFPSQKAIDTQTKQKHKQFRPTRHMSIGSKQLQKCYPYCVILMSIIQMQKNQIQGNFSIMASDGITQIPQKQKFDIVISAEEQKQYLIDLKYAIDQDKDVFFYSSTSIGLVNIYADVYSEKNDRIPDEDQHDFHLMHQTVLDIEKIKEIIEDQSMDQHNNIYLYLVVIAVSDSKVSIEFGFDQKDEQLAKLITIDTMERLVMPAKSSKMFYTILDQPFQLKITRESGFPFLFTKDCKQKLNECIEQVKDEDNSGNQILTKVEAHTAVPCPTCFYFFKITTKQDPATIQMHLQSSASQIQLTESKPVYDFTEKSEANNYILYAVRGEQIFINVDVSQGKVDIEITDLHQINMKKSGKQLISFTIPTQQKSNQHNYQEDKKQKFQAIADKSKQNEKMSKQLIQYMRKDSMKSQTYLSAFGLSENFIVLHVRITSQDQEKQSIYTISYSSGQIQFDLQDGLVTDYQLDGGKDSTFYYSSKHKGHAYLVLSMEKTKELEDLSISLKYCQPKDDIIDQDCWVEFKSSKPPIKDKTPNPSIMYSLPSYNYFAITLNYDSSGSTKVTLGINHLQVMLLPLEKQFPFILHKTEDVSMLAEISSPGYIYATVRKCDESSPTFSYTFDYDSFQDDDFSYETVLSQNPKSQFFSKVSPGTMYLKFKSPQQISLMSIYLKFTEKKTKQTSISAGGKGQLTYSVIDSKTAQISFKPPVCSDSNCSGKMKYYLMTATKKRDLYSQLICPSNFFSLYQTMSVDTIKDQQLSPKQNSDGTLSLTVNLVDQISYVGIRAVDSKNRQVFYKPIQVATLWGQLSRTSHAHKWTIFSFVIISLLALMIFVRRKSRQGYKPIEEDY